MGGKLREVEAERERREGAVMALLVDHSRKRAAEPAGRPTVDAVLTARMREWSGFWLRQPGDWSPRTRSRDARRLRLDLARHLFQAYPVPRFLEDLWLDDAQGRPHRDAKAFLGWYVAAAAGMSLYKECASHLLSRKEVHLFLAAPDALTPSQNIWWARARGAGASLGTANNIARARFSRMDPKDEFWTAAMRLFARHPELRLAEMDDLLDYLMGMRAERPDAAMKGRTLETLRRGSDQWHRLQAKQKEHDGAVWAGSPLEDWEWTLGSAEKGNLVVWRVQQIRGGRDLVKEGHAQHHCVASYKNRCIAGNSSIWSMTRDAPLSMSPGPKRALTIELDSYDTMVQARGYANRGATQEEREVLSRWCSGRNVRLAGWY